MSKNFYIGNGNIAREGQDIYVGIDGVARKVKSGYVGVNGKARKFWPSTIYVWKRYTTVEKPVYTYTTSSANAGIWYDANGSVFIHNLNSFDTTTGEWAYVRVSRPTSVGTNWFDGPLTTVIYHANGRVTSGGDDTYTVRYDKIAISQDTGRTQLVQGIYIDQVFSENPSQYPQNGVSGSYWYVYQGTQG